MLKTSVATIGLIFYLALGLNAINAAPKAPSDYLVTSLPGYVGSFPSFKIYSGYITVDEAHGRNLFFLFAESQNNPSTDPVILWLQGGPGCSGLIGLTSENGFLIPNGNPNGGMQPNGWSWNRFANMLYIESPAGVGFSYSQNKSDYTTGDNQTAADNYTFLKRFFSIFTAYRNNDFYVSGESYGGVYGPTLVYNIVTGGDQNLRNQLKGFMLGNPVIDCSEYGIIVHGMPLQVQLYFWHAMVSYNDFHAFDVAGCNQLHPPNPAKCQEIFNGMNVGHRGENTEDNLYYNHCTGNGTLDVLETVPNCITFEDIQTSWLNRVDVQKAIHARHVAWSGCSSSINYITSNPSMLSYVKDIVASKPGLKILFYSGDVDIATVPHAYTQFCLAQLKRPIVKKWRPYYLPNNVEVAGYVEAYDQFTFATIKGAGHEAPQYQPAKAFHIISNFVKSGSIP